MKRLSYFVAGGATFLFSAFLTATAPAQTTPPANQNQGAFEKLPPGEQKIADALFAAEQKDSSTAKPLSRDDIAAMKMQGKGWGEVFKDMQSKGLVKEKNLGQVVSRSNRDIREDRRDIREDKRDIKEDRRDLREDRRDLREDLKSGAGSDKIQADRQDIRNDEQDLKKDRQDLRQDKKDFREDRAEARHDRPERHERPERPHR